MPTTAGSGCWGANQTTDDAVMVKGLRADGAIMIAKASMDEFAINTSSQFASARLPAPRSTSPAVPPHLHAQQWGG